MNLMQGVLREMNRVRQLIPLYQALPNGVGMMGATLLQINIQKAEHAIASGDVIMLLQVYNELKECE